MVFGGEGVRGERKQMEERSVKVDDQSEEPLEATVPETNLLYQPSSALTNTGFFLQNK